MQNKCEQNRPSLTSQNLNSRAGHREVRLQGGVRNLESSRKGQILANNY